MGHLKRSWSQLSAPVLGDCSAGLGEPMSEQRFQRQLCRRKRVVSGTRAAWQASLEETRLADPAACVDNVECADQEFEKHRRRRQPRLEAMLSFDIMTMSQPP